MERNLGSFGSSAAMMDGSLIRKSIVTSMSAQLIELEKVWRAGAGAGAKGGYAGVP